MPYHQLSNVRVESFEIRGLRRRFRPAKHVCGLCQELLLPFGDLGGMYPELLGQAGDRLVPFDCG